MTAKSQSILKTCLSEPSTELVSESYTTNAAKVRHVFLMRTRPILVSTCRIYSHVSWSEQQC